MIIRSAKELDDYQSAYEMAMRNSRISQRFPPEERYALTSQIRQSYRSVCMNLRETWSKRRSAVHFVSKLTDCDSENSESDTSLDFARDCGYISEDEHKDLVARCAQVGRMLGACLSISGRG
jgi:four helix bundle protein